MKRKLKKRLSSAGSKQRPPVVVVLGHIDHGKTSLLDKIRKSNLVARETGGITQHTNAYQVKVTTSGTTPRPAAAKIQNSATKKVTFIDTPGHAAFSKMRSRGSKVADLAVVVIAADEGFKQQTKESLEHIKSAGIPYLVAINKVDLPNLDLEKVKADLIKNGIELESSGGDIVAVPVSAKTGEGVKDLLEMVLLLAEMNEVKTDSAGELQAVVIESKLDHHRGPVATLIVRGGRLRTRDVVFTEGQEVKVKALFNDSGRPVREVKAGDPVEVLGFKKVPPVGARVGDHRHDPALKEKGTSATLPLVTIEARGEKKLKIILKADTVGTLEAVLASLPESIIIVDSGVGNLGEADVLLAAATQAELVSFRLKMRSQVAKLAQREKVPHQNFKTIHELVEEIEDKVLKIMEPTIDEEILGEAEIIADFEVKKKKIAGCRVTKGRITKKDRLHLKREGKVIGDCRIKSMKQGKEEVSRVEKGGELGIILNPSLDFIIGDMLISFHPKK
jgi:translation initiation factor IF-2